MSLCLLYCSDEKEALALMSSLLGHDTNSPQNSGNRSNVEQGRMSLKDQLHIDTKYYTVDVQISVVSSILNLLSVASSASAFIIILCGDERVPKEILDIQLGDSVQIVVGEKGLVGEALMVRQEWCVDNGYEYIEIDFHHAVLQSSAPSLSSATLHSTNSNDSDRELTGVPRIIEALQCAQWPSMVRKTPGITKQAAKVVSSADHENHASRSSKDEFERDAFKLDDISSAIEEAMQIRRDLQSSSLPDDTRKQRAADMALKLARLMCIDEDSD